MEVAAEDSADMEKADSEQTTPGDGRKKNLVLKLQRLKMRSLGMQRSYTPSSINMAAVYELRLKKLRRNNRSLAKALADQKIETQQWYSEVVSLKGQLQEANERLLRPLDNSSENLVEQEVDRRIKEIGEPLNAAISQAMENLLVVVENFSKVKQIANIRSSISRPSSSSSFSFPRSSGSRAPLGSCGNPSSPCQSVRPMVSGHVLQPAMVAIQKLDDVWKARLKERIQEREGEEMNMSTIGENSVASVGEENESMSQNDTLSTSQPSTEDPSSNVSESATESLSPKSPGKGGQSRRGRRSLENRREPFKSPVDRNNVPVSSASPVMSKTGEESNEVSNSAHLEHIEDPLEGPSWWYADSSSGRGRGRGRSRGRGRGRKRGHSRCDHGSSITSVNCSIEASSESEEEESFRKRSKSHINDDTKINDDSAFLSDVSKQILEHSYLDSPKTMLAKLEDLEAKSGRRSKSKSKGRSLRISETIPDNIQNQHHQHNFAVKGKDAIVAHNDDIVTKASGTSSMDNKSQSHIDSKAFEDSSVNIPESIGRDFLIRDSDLTCIGDISMDITEPITKILSQCTAEIKKGESKPNVNNTEIKKDISKDDIDKNDKQKFFKKETTSCLQKTSEVGKSPFDLSLMDDTYITIPPYSYQKNIEKENMPPDSSRRDLKNDDDENYDLNLRRVSIVLNDIMKSSESVNMMPDGTIMSPTVEEELNSNETTSTMNRRNSTLLNNKHNSRSKRNFCFSLKTLDPEGEGEDKDAPWTPDKKKRKSTNKKTQKSLNSKKNSSDPLYVPKKQTTRKTKSELIVPTNAKICEVMEADVEKSVGRKSNETKDSATVNEVFNGVDDNDPKTLLNDCYVKICRTPIKEVRKTIASVDDTCIFLDEDSLPDFGMLYRKMSTKDTSPVRASSCTKSDKKMELTEKIPVDCGVLGTTVEACQELEPDQAEDSGPDHIVPDEGGVVCLETGSDNGETMNLSDPVIIEEANDLPHIDTSEGIDITKIEKDSDVVEMEAPRKRRAALKITSFKEPNLHKKMRREGDSSVNGTNAPSKARSSTRSGRKSSCS